MLGGLDDFRVRVRENCVGSMDVSDYCQDHGVPLDPLSTPHTNKISGFSITKIGARGLLSRQL